MTWTDLQEQRPIQPVIVWLPPSEPGVSDPDATSIVCQRTHAGYTIELILNFKLGPRYPARPSRSQEANPRAGLSMQISRLCRRHRHRSCRKPLRSAAEVEIRSSSHGR
ncbi:unnamed protein product [Mycena citricolor]|uniref:Uncharacterized protein n=1 Tax=Mycena citricolor TaxID=2018698 RepID=A0AAD2HWZ3_9AGAR|nr:unnamed protein product [Mycena citricolor]